MDGFVLVILGIGIVIFLNDPINCHNQLKKIIGAQKK